MRTVMLVVSGLLVLVGLSTEARADDGNWCVSGFEQGPEYGKGGSQKSTVKDACAAQRARFKAWHFHGYVENKGSCFACWDEESSTCEIKAPQNGFKYVGAATCGKLPIASPSGGAQLFAPSQKPAPAPVADSGSYCVSGFEKGLEYGKTGSQQSTQKDGCADLRGVMKAWHFHGYVESKGTCLACWDEESSTCETQRALRYLGSTNCGALPVSTDPPKHIKPAPAKPSAPAKPAAPVKPGKPAAA